MAERPKTDAQIAEENNELIISNLTGRVRDSIERITTLSAWASQINDRLGWIISSVRASYKTGDPTDIDISDGTLKEILDKLEDLEQETMKAHDILIGESTGQD